MQRLCQFLHRGVPTQLRQEPVIHRPVVLHGGQKPLAHAVVPCLHGHEPCHGGTNVPVTMGLQIPSAVAEDPFPKPQTALLDQILEEHTSAYHPDSLFQHPAEHQRGELFHHGLVPFQQTLGKERRITAGRDLGQLLQIDPKRIRLLQRLHQRPGIHQLLFPAQADRRLTGAMDLGQVRNIQQDIIIPEPLQRLLQSPLRLPFHQGQEPDGRQGPTAGQGLQHRLPRGGPEYELIHSKNPPIPCWHHSSSAAPWPAARSDGHALWRSPAWHRSVPANSRPHLPSRNGAAGPAVAGL